MPQPTAYAVIGHPVAHSRSPWIHARFAELTGQSLRYTRLDLPPERFAQGLHQFLADGAHGCNVTVPHKFEAARLAQVSSERVQRAHAANTLWLHEGVLHADNTDGLGLVADLQDGLGLDLAGAQLLLIGAGGAAAGVLAPLLAAGPARLVLANRSLHRAQTLVAAHADLAALQKTELLAHALHGLEGDFDIIINATASSLNGQALPLEATHLRPGAWAYDMMYGPPAQPFMAWAHSCGARASDGLGMLVGQAAESFALWRGVRPPAAQVLAELRALLASGG